MKSRIGNLERMFISKTERSQAILLPAGVADEVYQMTEKKLMNPLLDLLNPIQRIVQEEVVKHLNLPRRQRWGAQRFGLRPLEGTGF